MNSKIPMKISPKSSAGQNSNSAATNMTTDPSQSKNEYVDDSSSEDDSMFRGYNGNMEDTTSDTDHLSDQFSDDEKMTEYYENKLLEYSTLAHIDNSATDTSEDHVPDSLKEMMYENCQAKKRASKKVAPDGTNKKTHSSNHYPSLIGYRQTTEKRSTPKNNTRHPIAKNSVVNEQKRSTIKKHKG